MEVLAAAIFLPRYSVEPVLGLVPISGAAICLSDALVGVNDMPLLATSSLCSIVYACLLLAFAAKRLSEQKTLEGIVHEAN
jgi:hypothetical protein